MHHPPDLRLASSYIPACLCIFKCTTAFVLFVFAPVSGWIGLFTVLVTDRILWNRSANSSILDVNAVCMGLVGGLMVMHARADGIKTLAHFGITGAWILLSSVQILGVTRLNRAYEVLYAAFAVSVLSCLYQAPERTELLALRSFVFVVANTTLPYLGVMLLHPDIDTYINACRTLLILLGEPEIASAWVAVYILCIGWQVRNTTNGGCNRRPQHSLIKYSQHQGSLYHYQTDDDAAYDDEAPPQHGGGSNMSDMTPACDQAFTKGSIPSALPIAHQPPAISSTSSQGEEAALLREALASRKGFREA